VKTFSRKFLQESDRISTQPSLFDGLIYIALDFLAKPKMGGHSVSGFLALQKEILTEQIPMDLRLFSAER